MEFTGDIGLWQRRIAEGTAGNARRAAVLDALAIHKRQSILDIGCGGGHLVREYANAVGTDGHAVGLDGNADQLQAARDLCRDLPSAALIEGDATAMSFEDGQFDGLSSIQTLEYIVDLESALAEARRVMKRGGKAAFVSILWDHFRFHGAEIKLNERIHAAWRTHCIHQMLPLQMEPQLNAAGFSGVTRKPLVYVETALHEGAYAYWVSKILAAYATSQGVNEDEAQLWIQQLEISDQEGRFGFVCIPVLTLATAI